VVSNTYYLTSQRTSWIATSSSRGIY